MAKPVPLKLSAPPAGWSLWRCPPVTWSAAASPWPCDWGVPVETLHLQPPAGHWHAGVHPVKHRAVCWCVRFLQFALQICLCMNSVDMHERTRLWVNDSYMLNIVYLRCAVWHSLFSALAGNHWAMMESSHRRSLTHTCGLHWVRLWG